jgi:ClpP class serine protease
MANDVGTLLFGPEAVEIGLIDEVGSLQQALKKLRELAETQEKEIDRKCKK